MKEIKRTWGVTIGFCAGLLLGRFAIPANGGKAAVLFLLSFVLYIIGMYIADTGRGGTGGEE